MIIQANYSLIALKYALRNDYKTNVEMFFRYASVFGGEGISKIRKNKWILLEIQQTV